MKCKSLSYCLVTFRYNFSYFLIFLIWFILLHMAHLEAFWHCLRLLIFQAYGRVFPLLLLFIFAHAGIWNFFLAFTLHAHINTSITHTHTLSLFPSLFCLFQSIYQLAYRPARQCFGSGKVANFFAFALHPRPSFLFPFFFFSFPLRPHLFGSSGPQSHHLIFLITFHGEHSFIYS